MSLSLVLYNAQELMYENYYLFDVSVVNTNCNLNRNLTIEKCNLTVENCKLTVEKCKIFFN